MRTRPRAVKGSKPPRATYHPVQQDALFVSADIDDLKKPPIPAFPLRQQPLPPSFSLPTLALPALPRPVVALTEVPQRVKPDQLLPLPLPPPPPHHARPRGRAGMMLDERPHRRGQQRRQRQKQQQQQQMSDGSKQRGRGLHVVDWTPPSRIVRPLSRDTMSWSNHDGAHNHHQSEVEARKWLNAGSGLVGTRSAPSLVYSSMYARTPAKSDVFDGMLPPISRGVPRPHGAPPLPSIGENAPGRAQVEAEKGNDEGDEGSAVDHAGDMGGPDDASAQADGQPQDGDEDVGVAEPFRAGATSGVEAAIPTLAGYAGKFSTLSVAEAEVMYRKHERWLSPWARPLPMSGKTPQVVVLDEARRRLGRPLWSTEQSHLVDLHTVVGSLINNKKAERAIRSCPTFSSLTRIQTAMLSNGGSMIRAKRYAVLYRAGAAATCFYILLRGALAVVRPGEEGNDGVDEHSSLSVNRGETSGIILGLEALSSAVPRKATVTVSENAELLCFHTRGFALDVAMLGNLANSVFRDVAVEALKRTPLFKDLAKEKIVEMYDGPPICPWPLLALHHADVQTSSTNRRPRLAPRPSRPTPLQNAELGSFTWKRSRRSVPSSSKATRQRRCTFYSRALST